MATSAKKANRRDYDGPDRRRHKVYVTHNTEYHTREGVCVGVRDRRTGEWREGHVAVGYKIEGGVAFPGDGGFLPHLGEPSVGEAMLFNPGKQNLITSRVERIDRPPRDVVERYPGRNDGRRG
jgi:hypothetical protein